MEKIAINKRLLAAALALWLPASGCFAELAAAGERRAAPGARLERISLPPQGALAPRPGLASGAPAAPAKDLSAISLSPSESEQPGKPAVAAPQSVGQAAMTTDDGAPVAIETNGPRWSRAASRVALRLNELKAFLLNRRDGVAPDVESTPAGELTPSEAGRDSTPRGSESKASEPPKPPEPPKPSQNPWRQGLTFIVGLVVAQVGVEAWAAAWPKWVQANFGIDHYATVTVIGMLAGIAAGYAGGWAADHAGLKKSYIASSVLYATLAAATLLFFKAGALGYGGLLGLAAARAFMGSAGKTAEQTIPIAIFKGDSAALQRYNSIAQFILEIAGIVIPFSIGALLGLFGAIGTMALLPIATGAAATLFVFLLKLGDAKTRNFAAPTSSGSSPNPPASPLGAASLRLASLAYPAVVLLNFLLYNIIAIGYGNFLHPGASPLEQAAAAGVAGKLVSLYSLGGLVAAATLSGLPGALWRWAKKRWPRLARTGLWSGPQAADDAASELRGAGRWMLLSALGLAGFLPMLGHSAALAAAAMIPFGLANTMASLRLLSMVQANVPRASRGKVMGRLRTVSVMAATAGIFAFGRLFKAHPASLLPFWVLLGLLAALVPYHVWLALKMRSAARRN